MSNYYQLMSREIMVQYHMLFHQHQALHVASLTRVVTEPAVAVAETGHVTGARMAKFPFQSATDHEIQHITPYL
jgi:hypothetical protein